MGRLRLAACFCCLLACLPPALARHTARARAPRAVDKPTAASELPATPAGKQLAALLAAVNTGKADVLRKFHSDHFSEDSLKRWPAEARTRFWLEHHYANGGFDPDRVEKSTEGEIIILARGRISEDWLRFSVAVEANPPHRITQVGFFIIDPPADALTVGKRPTEAEVLQRLKAYLDKLAAGDLFSGVVLVAKDGKPIFRRAYGLASQAYSVPNRVDTKFNVASINKMFTAVAVAQLAQAGKLSFQDRLIEHLPDYPKKEVAEKVTIHHLLTHTSGMGDCLDNLRFLPSKEKIRRVRDYFPLFVDEPLAFEPGEKFKYSNVGFIVLGAVIERVSGQDYFEYVREHIFKPAGMGATDFYELDRDTPNLAIGYELRLVNDRPVLLNNTHLLPLRGCPAGLGYSTADDLLRFDVALRGYKLLDERHTRMVLEGKVERGAGGSGRSKYAYGFFDGVVNGQRIVEHGGGFVGIDTSFDMYIDNGYTVVVLANRGWGTGQRIKYRLWNLLTQK